MRVQFGRWLGGLLGMCWALGNPVWGTAAETLDSALELLQSIQQAPSSLARAIDAGQDRAVICGYCHGRDGNSVKPEIPKLAAQNPAYILRQFDHFASGNRRDYVMQEMAASLTWEERINLALYFSSLTSRPRTADPELVAEGGEIFNTVCANCHGVEGHGNINFPRLAGQNPIYLKNALAMFSQRNGDRSNPLMVEIVKKLTEQDIEAVTAYISTLE